MFNGTSLSEILYILLMSSNPIDFKMASQLVEMEIHFLKGQLSLYVIMHCDIQSSIIVEKR